MIICDKCGMKITNKIQHFKYCKRSKTNNIKSKKLLGDILYAIQCGDLVWTDEDCDAKLMDDIKQNLLDD